LRLAEYGRRVGLLIEADYIRARERKLMYNELLVKLREKKKKGKSYFTLLKQKDVTINHLAEADDELSNYSQSVIRSVEIEVKYSGYIARQNEKIEQFKKMENLRIPENIAYPNIEEISREAREKLARIQPASLGQASRVPGVKPADITNLMYYIRRVYSDTGKKAF
jgi:tRNA uridine 5-carboxymethylaminomethyl modification enzyme